MDQTQDNNATSDATTSDVEQQIADAEKAAQDESVNELNQRDETAEVTRTGEPSDDTQDDDQGGDDAQGDDDDDQGGDDENTQDDTPEADTEAKQAETDPKNCGHDGLHAKNDTVTL